MSLSSLYYCILISCILFLYCNVMYAKYIKLTNREATRGSALSWACVTHLHSALRKLNTEPSIDASYQVSYHLAKRFQRKSCFRNLTIQGSTLTVVWLPGESEMSLRATENGTQLVRSGKWKYRDCSFRFDPLTNMAATGNSCFRLVAF
jgi:hypothetical protein